MLSTPKMIAVVTGAGLGIFFGGGYLLNNYTDTGSGGSPAPVPSTSPAPTPSPSGIDLNPVVNNNQCREWVVQQLQQRIIQPLG
jgi:hypothetical protein